MLEINMLKKSKFAWHNIQLSGHKNKYLIANGFNAWSCVIPHEEDYYTISGGNNSSDIKTSLIYKGDKLTAIAKGNDFLYEVEDQGAARRSATWRNYLPSVKQREIIKKFKTKYVGDECTKGYASALIAFEFNVKRIIQKIGVLV